MWPDCCPLAADRLLRRPPSTTVPFSAAEAVIVLAAAAAAASSVVEHSLQSRRLWNCFDHPTKELLLAPALAETNWNPWQRLLSGLIQETRSIDRPAD